MRNARVERLGRIVSCQKKEEDQISMGQKGEHTWDLILDYHRCPQCGFIIESRVDFESRDGKRRKELSCDRCHHQFVVTKAIKPTFGPLIGEPQPKEMDWS